MTRIVFLDLETTGLDPDRHEPWEFGVIARTEDGDHEYRWIIPTDLAKADPNALRIGRYYERTAKIKRPRMPGYATNLALPNTQPLASDPHAVAADLAQLLDGAHIVGAVPAFDAAFLSRWLPRHQQAFTAHYHLIDVEALAVGWAHGVFRAHADMLDAQGKPHDAIDRGPTRFADLPWNSDSLSGAVGVDPGQFERHTALGDARWARAMYDAVTGGSGR